MIIWRFPERSMRGRQVGDATHHASSPLKGEKKGLNCCGPNANTRFGRMSASPHRRRRRKEGMAKLSLGPVVPGVRRCSPNALVVLVPKFCFPHLP